MENEKAISPRRMSFAQRLDAQIRFSSKLANKKIYDVTKSSTKKTSSFTNYTKEQIITKEIPVIQNTKTRWGLGVQAGVGAGKGGLSPYVGIGVSYNLLSW